MNKPEPGVLSVLEYCPDFHEVSGRLRLLFERKAGDRIFAVTHVPSPALDEFRRNCRGGFCEYPDISERLAFWDRHLSVHRGIHDDGVPSVYVTECDQGLYGGMVGGQVRYLANPETGWISSMVPPLLRDLSGVETLKVDRESLPFRRFLESLNLYVSGGRVKFGVSHLILIDSLNFVFELIGATSTYMALLEQPRLVRRAVGGMQILVEI